LIQHLWIVRRGRKEPILGCGIEATWPWVHLDMYLYRYSWKYGCRIQ
jgi:hypothetical protein